MFRTIFTYSCKNHTKEYEDKHKKISVTHFKKMFYRINGIFILYLH